MVDTFYYLLIRSLDNNNLPDTLCIQIVQYRAGKNLLKILFNFDSFNSQFIHWYYEMINIIPAPQGVGLIEPSSQK